MITIWGEVDVAIGDGTTLRFGPGDVVIAEDLTGQGQSTRPVGDEPWIFVAIPSDQGFPKYGLAGFR